MQVSLSDVRKARETLKGVIRETEMLASPPLSERLGTSVYLKLENTQYTGSFKLRGAYNKIHSLTDAEKKRGVIASSAGNHAQGVALSALKAGVKATIVMPEGAPLVKVEATKSYGATVVTHGDVVDDSTARARELEKEKGYVFVHPFEDPMVIAGQGSLGLEILEAIPDLDSLIVPIGGGGLISGIATAVKALRPQCRIYGVQSAAADGMIKLFKHISVDVANSRCLTIADGIAVKKPSQQMLQDFISKLVDDVYTVTDDEIAEAIVFLLERSKTVVEGAGAAGLAALMNRQMNLGQKTCVLLSGGNIDLNIVSKIIQKGQIRRGRLCELAVVVDDLPGSLNRLTRVIADLRANVLEVHHDRVSHGLFLRETRIEFVLETTGPDHIEQVKAGLTQAGGRILGTKE